MVGNVFDFSADGGLLPAAELCAGVGECRKTRQGTMCPSFQATRDERDSNHSAGDFLDLQRNNRTLEALAGYREDVIAAAARPGEPVQVQAAWVTSEFFDVLGTPPALGRTFTRLQDGATREKLVVLGHATWLQLFAGDTEVALSLLGSFALMALVLAAAGIYGVMAYAVAQRRLEFGIRLALGAAPRDLVRLVAVHSLRLTAVGIFLGLAGARLTSSLLGNLVQGVGATDPRVFLATAAFLGVISMLACLVPALRATRVDPNEALRAQ